MRFSRSKASAMATLLVATIANLAVLPAYTKELAPRAIADRRSIPRKSLATGDAPSLALANEAYGKLPLSFEANQGQFDSRVKFVSRAHGHTVFLTATEAILKLYANTELRETSGVSTIHRPWI